MAAFCQNTNVLDLLGLRAEIGDAFINDAICSVSIRDATGAEVVAMPMTHLAGSNGDYRAILSESLPLVAGAKYTAIVEADAGFMQFGHFEMIFKPQVRAAPDA